MPLISLIFFLHCRSSLFLNPIFSSFPLPGRVVRRAPRKKKTFRNAFQCEHVSDSRAPLSPILGATLRNNGLVARGQVRISDPNLYNRHFAMLHAMGGKLLTGPRHLDVLFNHDALDPPPLLHPKRGSPAYCTGCKRTSS
jgi:hypothetical protein